MRSQTLTGAAIPVLLGCALAYIFGKFQPVPALLCFLFAFLMQTDANFINDLYDYLKGTDREDRLGPERACAQGWITPAGMKRGIAVTTLLACCVGLGLLSYGGWEMIPVGLACVVFAFLYTAGPYPLAYHGWGDVLVLIFFGFVPVGCTFYVMAHSWNTAVFVVSLACGLIIDTLLMVNTSATGAGCSQRKANTRGPLRGTHGAAAVFSARNGRMLALLLLYLAGKNLCGPASPALSDTPYSYNTENGTYRKGKSPEPHSGRDLTQHVAFRSAPCSGTDSLNSSGKSVFFNQYRSVC